MYPCSLYSLRPLGRASDAKANLLRARCCPSIVSHSVRVALRVTVLPAPRAMPTKATARTAKHKPLIKKKGPPAPPLMRSPDGPKRGATTSPAELSSATTVPLARPRFDAGLLAGQQPAAEAGGEQVLAAVDLGAARNKGDEGDIIADNEGAVLRRAVCSPAVSLGYYSPVLPLPLQPCSSCVGLVWPSC
jgi:hypothetical protein